MFPRVTPLLSGLAALTLLTLGAPEPVRAQGEMHPDLSGHWQVVPDREDPAAKLQEPLRAGSDRQGEGPEGIGGDGRPEGGLNGRGARGDRPRNWGPPSDRDREKMRETREAMQQLLRGTEAFQIVQAPDTVHFVPLRVEDTGWSVATDGKKAKIGEGDQKVELKARWEGSTLQVERKFANGLRLSEDYALSMDRSHLLVDVVIKGGGRLGQVQFRRVYQRAEASAPSVPARQQ